jgi:hypothetical protein
MGTTTMTSTTLNDWGAGVLPMSCVVATTLLGTNDGQRATSREPTEETTDVAYRTDTGDLSMLSHRQHGHQGNKLHMASARIASRASAAADQSRQPSQWSQSSHVSMD